MKDLQPEQSKAAYTLDHHISVTAGPGSGKTTVLVERYLHILRERQPAIDQIVAITFTNRAANEMRERLRGELNETLRTTSGEERRRWLSYKRTLDGAVITTIHGFCARLLREFPLEARVDPQFVLLDEHRAAMLLESVVEETLTEFINSGHAEISRLTLGMGRLKLAAALSQLYRDARGQGLSFTELATLTAVSHESEEAYGETLNLLKKCFTQFLNRLPRSVKAETKRMRAAEEWPNVLATISEPPDHSSLAEYCLAIERFREHRPDKTAIGDLAGQIDDLLWGKGTNKVSGQLPQLCFDLFARQYALEMAHTLSRIDERLTEEKQKLSALDFDDLELRALALLERPEVLSRTAERYQFFLVDEFQDTNDLQRRLLERLALREGSRDAANLFIVGDRKQSIYGFRGADVDVFREISSAIVAAGGEAMPLPLNFRSQPPLINFFNYLFARLFLPTDESPTAEREELGYVAHEPSVAKRDLCDEGPLVELLITTEATTNENDPKAEQTSRELDAQQLVQRIIELIGGVTAPAIVRHTSTDEGRLTEIEQFSLNNSAGSVEGRREACAPRDIALLFRAMTNVQVYESAFRRANIPYQTVLGRGFYEREEITDLIQLLRFLDNKTDELALAAVLRSPLCGLSDNALLALRCGPTLQEVEGEDRLKHFTQTRNLLPALRRHRDIAYITEAEHELLDRAGTLINELISRRHHYPIAELLRYAVTRAEYQTVIAANFDGAQRLANVERLFTLAERFERSGSHLIRDFVRYVEEFEAIGSRESEGQIDEAADAVRLMTIHQAKGLEFPIVIIPELQRQSRMPDNWVLLDRHQGLTLKVPDGRGKQVAGCTFTKFEERQSLREHFESMRLLYVAATRAQDRLILSGTVRGLNDLEGRTDTWLKWIWNSLELGARTRSGIIQPADAVELLLSINPTSSAKPSPQRSEQGVEPVSGTAESLLKVFPLLPSIQPSGTNRLHRFSVTQLVNYRRCPRQYYFERVMHLPNAEEMAVWNDAEAPEPPANLTATLKGAVIHRFCEFFVDGDDLHSRLVESFRHVIRLRLAQFADRLLEIDEEKAIAELAPLAQNYVESDLFQRVSKARESANCRSSPDLDSGISSELTFRLRRPIGILTGAIDKLLIEPLDGDGVEIEIIDFKTNRFQRNPAPSPRTALPPSVAPSPRRRVNSTNQFAFDFDGTTQKTSSIELSDDNEIERIASDYQLQMQAYALAVRDLILPRVKGNGHIAATLHFLDPNREYRLSPELLEENICSAAVDDAMHEMVSSLSPVEFPVNPAHHCRRCSYLELCAPGREWLRQQ